MQAEMRWGRKSWRGGGRVRRTARCARPHHGEATAGRQCCGGGRACAALPWVPGRRELSSWLWQRQLVRTPHPRKGAGSPGRWARPQATQHMAMAGAAGRPTQLQPAGRTCRARYTSRPDRLPETRWAAGYRFPLPSPSISFLPPPLGCGNGNEAREPRSICSRAFRHIGRCLTLTLGRTINLMAVLTCNRGDFAGTASH